MPVNPRPALSPARASIMAVLATLALAATAGPSLAANPSFSCKRASSATERLICSSAQLAKLDRRMAAAYGQLKSAMRSVGDHASLRELKASQRQWLASRNACGADHDCIAAEYRDRLNVLADWEFGEA